MEEKKIMVMTLVEKSCMLEYWVKITTNKDNSFR